MDNNIVQAQFNGRRTAVTTRSIWQYDYGMQLVFGGLELPTAYTVHFSNYAAGGQAVQQVGDSGGVSIPDALLRTGLPVYAFVFLHTGADDGETVYTALIPVNKRPEPTDEEPTPAQQSAIDEAITALNTAVDEAEEAITHYPRVNNGVWETWDVTSGAYVSTGVPATGPQGETGATGAQGPKGDKGDKGDTGAAGPQGETGPKGDTGEQGPKGDTGDKGDKGDKGDTGEKGDTGATGPQGEQGPKGDTGATGAGIPTGGTTGQILAKKTGTDYDTEWQNPSGGTVTDVQVNGTSVLSSGVANITPSSLDFAVTVSGTTPSITGASGTRYICGEVTTLDITPPSSGIIDVVFESGSTATVLTVTPPTGMTMKWANGFDPTALEANTVYEINIMDGCLGVAGTWS